MKRINGKRRRRLVTATDCIRRIQNVYIYTYDLALLTLDVFSARCYAERGYVAVRRLSVCPSVRDVQVCFSHRLEYFENNFTAE